MGSSEKHEGEDTAAARMQILPLLEIATCNIVHSATTDEHFSQELFNGQVCCCATMTSQNVSRQEKIVEMSKPTKAQKKAM